MEEEFKIKNIIRWAKCLIGAHEDISLCQGGYIRCYDCGKNYCADNKEWIKEKPRRYMWTDFSKKEVAP